MKRLLRILLYVTYPFLALSLLLVAGMMFGAAFVTDFTVENRTGGSISITPVGVTEQAGHRAPLPVKLLAFPPLPALRAGGFRLADGEAATIRYDMDDITLSEIVIEDERGRSLQLVTDPIQRHYVIDDLSQLGAVSPPVRDAAAVAHRQWIVAVFLFLLLVGPWVVYGGITWMLGRWDR